MASTGWGDTTTNQKLAKAMGYSWGDAAQDNHNGGGRCRIVSAIKFGGKKINKAKFIVA
jgi:hypothetical protein